MTLLISGLLKVDAQALLLEGSSKPFTLKQLVSPFAELKDVDTVVVLSERRIGVRKTGELGFRMYTSGLEMLSSSMANELLARREGYVAFRIGDKWGLADSTGDVKIKPRFDEIGLLGKDGNLWVRQETKWGIISRQGKWVEKPKINKDGRLGAYRVDFRIVKGIRPVKTERGWTLTDSAGNICPHQYFDSLTEGSSGIYIYSMGQAEDHWSGLINKDCEILVPGTYRKIGGYKGNYAVCSKDGIAFNYMDLNGDEIFLGKSFVTAEPAVGGYGAVINHGKWEVMTLKDPVALPVYMSIERNAFSLIPLGSNSINSDSIHTIVLD